MKGLKPSVDRREFVRIGLASLGGGIVAGGASAQSQSRSEGRALPAAPLEHTFLVEPGAVSEIDSKTLEILHTAPWAIPAEFERFVPSLLTPLSLTVSQVEGWLRDRANGCCSLTPPATLDSAEPLDVLMSVPLAGAPDMADIAGSVVASLSDGKALDLRLEFLLGSESSPSHRISSRAGFPVFEATGAPRAAKASVPSAIVIDLGGLKIQITGPDTHPLGTCVTEPVKHFHVEVFRRRPDGTFDLAATYSLGGYRSGDQRCFVLFSDAPQVCQKICNPTKADLAAMFKIVIASAQAVLGISLPAWYVAVIAGVLASIVYVALFLLA